MYHAPCTCTSLWFLGKVEGECWQPFSGQWSHLIRLEMTESQISISPIHISRDGH